MFLSFGNHSEAQNHFFFFRNILKNMLLFVQRDSLEGSYFSYFFFMALMWHAILGREL